MNPESIIDLPTYETLKEAMGADFMDELLQAYYDETPQLLSRLQRALDDQDCEAFRLAAHSIKSTSKSFGALQFGDLAKELEMIGREGKLAGSDRKVEQLTGSYEAVRQALEGLSHDK